jgi:D-alanyl-D-alanine carboxypeptidase/D-alanyl-D-alanine-endopeptidase (penicillin-binding protein 4)
MITFERPGAVRRRLAAVASAVPIAGGGAVEGAKLAVERDSTGDGLVVRGTIVAGDSETVEIAFRDQVGAYLAVLGEALRDRGIVVSGARVDSAAGVDTLFTVLSPPLREILPALEKPSQNQIAEVLFRTLGLERAGVGSPDSGRAVVERQLAAWGADSAGFAVRDGSGLSRHDYLSPATVVRVLTAIRADTAFRVFYDALPVAGVDGTIGDRMRGTAAQGNVHAKTGFVDKARSLSGYVTTADGELLVFSLLCNNWTVPVEDVERVQDAIATLLAGSRYAALRPGRR